MFIVLTPIAELQGHYGHLRLTVPWQGPNLLPAREIFRGACAFPGKKRADLNLVQPRYAGRTRR